MTTAHDPRMLTRQADPSEMALLAAALGDTPETVIAQHLLTTGACSAWYAGDVRQPRAVAVQALRFPEEPLLFGETPEVIARLLPHLRGWTSLSVPIAHARGLERPVAVATGTYSLRTLEDVYHVLDGSMPPVEAHPAARLLTPDDAALLEGMPLDSLDDGTIIAAAIMEGEIVALAHTFAWSARYVDLGVTTHEAWRGQGLGTSVAALVARAVRERGLVPVWSCATHNAPSLRIARRLGFRETSRRLYLIPELPDRES
mgnify:CR=1 FL=1